MRKPIAIILAGAIALSLTACGKKELQVKNYTISQEAQYYHELSGGDVSCKISISMHPSLYNSALTMPTVKNVISDEWYNDSPAEEVTFGVYKSMTESEEYNADTLLILTINGSDTNLNKGINEETVGKYLDRYFTGSEKKSVIEFITKINSDTDKKSDSMTVNYKIGGMFVSFDKNNDDTWTLEIDAYSNNNILDENDFIDSDKSAELEPYVSESYITSVIGEKKLVVDYKSAYDLFELRSKMENAGYQTVNAIYQSDRSVTANISDNGETVTYYTGVSFKPKNGKGETVAVKQSYTVDIDNKTVKYTLSQPNEDIPDGKIVDIITNLTQIDNSTAKSLLEKKGEEIKIDDSTTAVIDKDRNLTVTIKLG